MAIPVLAPSGRVSSLHKSSAWYFTGEHPYLLTIANRISTSPGSNPGGAAFRDD